MRILEDVDNIKNELISFRYKEGLRIPKSFEFSYVRIENLWRNLVGDLS